jgi:hypothetical protein
MIYLLSRSQAPAWERDNTIERYALNKIEPHIITIAKNANIIINISNNSIIF